MGAFSLHDCFECSPQSGEFKHSIEGSGFVDVGEQDEVVSHFL